MNKLVSIAAVVLLVAVYSCEGVHRPPFSHQEARLHENFHEMLNVKAHLESADAKPFRHPDSKHTMKTLANGEWQGLRIAFNFDRLDDATKTCQAPSPADKLKHLEGSTAPDGADVDINNPSDYYAGQDLPTIPVLDRRINNANAPNQADVEKQVKCEERWQLDDSEKSYIKTSLLPRVRNTLKATVSPIVQHAGNTPISGNRQQGSSLVCINPLYTWDNFDPTAYANHDLVIMVTAEPDWAPSWSFPCQIASDGRPSVIVMNINPKYLSMRSTIKGQKTLYNRFLQSILKSMGLSMSMIGLWQQPSVISTVNDVRGHKITMVTTPKVRAFVENVQFNCQGNPNGGTGTIGGAELEDAGDDNNVAFYWEKRVFRGEVMTLYDFNKDTPDAPPPEDDEALVMSGLTLAALEDSGWYKANTGMAQKLKWGHNEACNWATQLCDSWSSRYLCNQATPNPVPSCSPDHTAIASCNMVEFPSGVIPAHFQYNSNPLLGGRDKLMDYCPVLTNSKSCLKPVTNPGAPLCNEEVCPEFHVSGPGSRCLPSTIHYKKFAPPAGDPAPQPAATCLQMECQGTGADVYVAVNVAGQVYSCFKAGDKVGPSVINPSGFSTSFGAVVLGEITCPDPIEFCKNAGAQAFENACDPIFDCSAHGTCNADGSCQCFTACGPDPNDCAKGSQGFFKGKRCNECQEGFAPPDCIKRTCPKDPKTQQPCYGNGQCDDATGTCKCFNDDQKGHFDATTDCRECASGWVGGSCKIAACKTGLCNNGVCDPNTKLCNCKATSQAGFWGGTFCNSCKEGYDPDTGCTKRFSNVCPACPTITDNTLQPYTSTREIPVRLTPRDQCACPIGTGWPSTTTFSACPNGPACSIQWEVLQIDCKGFPMLYETCWETDTCSCPARPRAQCQPGTDAVASPSAYPDGTVGGSQLRSITGGSDSRAPIKATVSDKHCKCPLVNPPPTFDCLGTQDPVTGRAVNLRHEVWFEPEQVYFEDFCHCVSPSIPKCSDATAPSKRAARRHGTRFNCNDMECPDWDRILNIGQKFSANTPDLSLIDCDNFPAPKLRAAKDRCGCSFPQFKCKAKTEGICAPDSCPKWDDVTINCQGKAPPVLNWHGPHPCGCKPPPPITCIEGTGPDCDCKVKERETIWVDCKGMPIKQPNWTPFTVFPFGDPFVQPCDPCPMCPTPAPLIQCIPGTDKPFEKSKNLVANCPNGPLSPFPDCPLYPPPCPVDCKGKPAPAPKTFDPQCECPPPPQPACIDGTDGKVVDVNVKAGTCASTPHMCFPYICGDSASPAILTHIGRVAECEDRQSTAMDMLPEGESAYCVQEGSCASDNDCVCGFKCGPCGICIEEGLQPKGCLADPSICGDYACKPSCTAEGIKQIKSGNLNGVCVEEGQCTQRTDCQGGALCMLPTYTQHPLAGSAVDGSKKVIGEANDIGGSNQSPDDDVPGVDVTYNPPTTDPFADVSEYVPKKNGGSCLRPQEPNPAATQYCKSHDECGNYACGKDNSQVFFSNSRCHLSCYTNDQCAPGFKCDRQSGSCLNVQNAPQGDNSGEGQFMDDGGCETHAMDFCAPYVCGSERAAAPTKDSQCRTHCSDDIHCQPGFECQIPTQEDVQKEADAQCDAQINQQSRHQRSLSRRVRRKFGALANPVACGNANKNSALLNNDDKNAGKEFLGKCVPTQSMKQGFQSAEAVQAQRDNNPFRKMPDRFRLPPGAMSILLEYPMGDIDVAAPPQDQIPGRQTKLEQDPNSRVLKVAPFMPPAVVNPPPPGTPVGESPASCRPYKGGVRGATLGQTENMYEDAMMNNQQGQDASLPTCKTSCQTDDDCVGGFYCVQAGKVEHSIGDNGEKIYSDPNCNGPDGCQGKIAGGEGKQGDDNANQPIDDQGDNLKGTCQRKRSLATVCTQNNECGSGFCVQGICCNSQCNSPCQTCARMGICSWVAPQTDPRKQCGRCHWCDYKSGANGITPRSPMTCSPIPMGIDPNGNCGPHGTCNGEGGCLANPGWGGPNLDTCAPGKTGPNCDQDTVNYREVDIEVPLRVCTPDQVAQEAGAPSTDPTAVQQSGSAYKPHFHVLQSSTQYLVRTQNGFETRDFPTTYKQRAQVIDRRPRQFASKVNAISSHSQFSCRNILFEPSAKKDRVHGEKINAWSPNQYVKLADGSKENEDLKYFPFLDCRGIDGSTACALQAGCMWVTGNDGSYCTGDGTVVTPQDAKRELGLDVYSTIIDNQIEKKIFNKDRIAKPPLEWIELEFDEAVFIEAVQLFENAHPGSLVRIESQPIETGADALANAGGGAPDDLGDGNQKDHVTFGGNLRLEAKCARLTPFGAGDCDLSNVCEWGTDHRCHARNGTRCPTTEQACIDHPSCQWDAVEKRCGAIPNLPCGANQTCPPSGNATNGNGTAPSGQPQRRHADAQSAHTTKTQRTRFVGAKRASHHARRKEHMSDRNADDHPYHTFRFSPQSVANTMTPGHRHPHRLMQVLETGEDYVRAFCDVDDEWIAPQGESVRSPDYCNQRSNQQCQDGCKWNTGTTVNENTPLPPAGNSEYEGGSYGSSNPPADFTLKDAGPEYPSHDSPLSVHDMPPGPGNVPCDDYVPGKSFNKNMKPFETIWERSQPNFVGEKKYRSRTIPVGSKPYRSKVIRLTFAPTSEGRSQVEAVSIVGAQLEMKAGEILCGGEVWRSPLPEGTPMNAKINAAPMQSVPCNGNGVCGVKGCECFGNFYGKACGGCKLGWGGPACDREIPFGCRRALYEDLSQLKDDVVARWRFTNLHTYESKATAMRHFGSSMISPPYDLGGDHTHINIKANMLVVDVPQGHDVGVYLTLAIDDAGTGMQIVKVEKPTFFSGLNLIGTENGDYQGDIGVRVKWPYQSVVVNVTLWWGSGDTDTFVLTLNTIEVESCNFPDLGDDTPVPTTPGADGDL